MKKKRKRHKDFNGLSTVIQKKDKIPRVHRILVHKVLLILISLIFSISTRLISIGVISKYISLEIEAQYARIRVLEEEVSMVRKEKEIEENFKLKALQEVQVHFQIFQKHFLPSYIGLDYIWLQ